MSNGFFNYNHIRLKFTSSSPVKSRLKKRSHNRHKSFNPDLTHHNKDNLPTQSHKSWLKTTSQISFSNKTIIKWEKKRTTHPCIKWNQRISIRNKIGCKIWIRTSLVSGMILNRFNKFCSKRLMKVSKISKMSLK